MEAYIQPLYSDEKEIEIFFREAALSYKRAEHALYNDMSVFIEADEDEGKKRGAFQVVIDGIKNMLDNIINTIKNFIHAITSSFGSQLTVDVYMKSGTAEMRFNQDIERIGKQIDDEILEERKGVQAISNAVKKLSDATNIPIDSIIDAKTIAGAVDKVNSFVVKEGDTILKAGAITLLANKFHKSISENLKLTEKLKESSDMLEKKRQSVGESKLKYYEENGNKIMAYMQKMSNALNTTSTRAMKYYSQLTGNINNFKKTINENKNKKE